MFCRSHVSPAAIQFYIGIVLPLLLYHFVVLCLHGNCCSAAADPVRTAQTHRRHRHCFTTRSGCSAVAPDFAFSRSRTSSPQQESDLFACNQQQRVIFSRSCRACSCPSSPRRQSGSAACDTSAAAHSSATI